MKIKSLGVSVILVSLIFTQDVLSQVVFDDIARGYSIIDCSGMAVGAVKTADELAASKQPELVGGRVLRHRQYVSQQGDYIGGTNGISFLYINQKVSRKFAVAKSDAMAATDWARASGWASGANNDYTGSPGNATTGCAVYRGKDSTDESGCWRLPTQREFLIIYSLKDQLAGTTGFTAFSSGNYCCATEFDGGTCWYLRFQDGFMSATSKFHSYGVRCVRDL